MEKYVVMTNYGDYEGWKIEGQTVSFEQAIIIRENCLSLGLHEVIIFTPVKYIVTEVVDG